MKIQLEEVSLTLRGQPILQGITATIEAGVFTCLLGPNGAGKTMLFGILSGQVAATQGRVAVAGLGAAALQGRDIARRIAILPQGVQDPPYVSVRELVALGRFRPGKGMGWRLGTADEAAVVTALRQCNMERFAERPFSQLSGGEKQRAWLAFCLAQEKEFLLLDESLSALDFVAKQAFFQLLAALSAQGLGVLLSTHDLDMASRFANRLLVLQDGALVYDGPPRSDIPLFLTSPGVPAGDA